MIVVATAAGYLIGSLPTANAIARLVGVDLRTAGSGNPGTNNARKLGGLRIAIPILIVEVAKGATAGALGLALGGPRFGIAAGVTAILGNVINIWYRGQGGKGLAISAGVLLAVWPFALPLAVVVIIVLVATTRSTGLAALGALAALVALSLLSTETWPSPWGIEDSGYLGTLAVAMAVVVGPKHLVDAIGRLRKPALR